MDDVDLVDDFPSIAESHRLGSIDPERDRHTCFGRRWRGAGAGTEAAREATEVSALKLVAFEDEEGGTRASETSAAARTQVTHRRCVLTTATARTIAAQIQAGMTFRPNQ